MKIKCKVKNNCSRDGRATMTTKADKTQQADELINTEIDHLEQTSII